MSTRRTFLGIAAGAAFMPAGRAADAPTILKPDDYRHYIDDFNATYKEEVINVIPDAQAWDFLRANIPVFTCPDAEFERIYYFRWWTYRKHIKQTPVGYLITEFLKPVSHASEYNALSCALGHHIAEGRWLRDRQYVEGDIHFWLRTGDNGGIRKNLHQFSGWVAAALYDRYLVQNDREALISYLDALEADYAAWDAERLTPSGLYWQRDVSDGMEESASGGRKVKNIRPSINSYMYGNAVAIAAISTLAGRADTAGEYKAKAEKLRDLTLQRLWNPQAKFFETLDESGAFVPVRENIGYTPWYFNLPPAQPDYDAPWSQLTDPEGFSAPFGPTTCERRSPDFKLLYQGDDCQWDGPAWPFATTITLRALAKALNRTHSSAVTTQAYFDTLATYVKSQHLKLDDGRTVPWIDENQNPLTGDWIARTKKKGKPGFYERGEHYNHSCFADLVITGLCGLRPRADQTVEVNPLLPAGKWDWFALDRIPYHGRSLAIVWDKAGNRFHKGAGLRVFADGKEIAHSRTLTRVTASL